MNEIEKIGQELNAKRHEIIDLFCKTFLVCNEVYTAEALKVFFESHELVCRQLDNANPLNQAFYFQKKTGESIIDASELWKLTDFGD